MWWGGWEGLRDDQLWLLRLGGGRILLYDVPDTSWSSLTTTCGDAVMKTNGWAGTGTSCATCVGLERGYLVA